MTHKTKSLIAVFVMIAALGMSFGLIGLTSVKAVITLIFVTIAVWSMGIYVWHLLLAVYEKGKENA